MVSSHVLVEVERFAENILVIINGKLAAAGDFRAIREKIDAHDHEVRIRASEPAPAGGPVIGRRWSSQYGLMPRNASSSAPSDVPDVLSTRATAAQAGSVRLFEIQPTDDSLTSVFSYLVEQ